MDTGRGVTSTDTNPHGLLEKNEGNRNTTNDVYPRRRFHIANASPLGLFSFAATLLILSLYSVHARGVNSPNAVIGMALFFGGLAQLLAGMWEFPRGNTFGATFFTSYGAFWLSLAIIAIPGTGVINSYATYSELRSAVGIYLFSWFAVTAFFLIAALRKNIGFIVFLSFLSLTYILYASGLYFTNRISILRGAGAIGIVTSLIAFYMGLSDLLASERSSIARLPIGVFNHDDSTINRV